MRSILLFFSIALLFAFGIAPSNDRPPSKEKGKPIDSDTIYWSKSRKLSWDDFIGIPDKSKKFSAVTVTSFKWFTITKGDTCRVIVSDYFFKKDSWKLPNANLAILNHEQGHFDLDEVYARLLRKYLVMNRCVFFSKTQRDEYKQKIHPFFSECVHMFDNIQDLYDDETQHGTDSVMQNQWNIRIANDLKSLEAYSDPDDK